MTNFFNKKNKLNFISSFNQEINQDFLLQDSVNQNLQSRIHNPIQYIFKKFHNFNSEWETLDEFIYSKDEVRSSLDFYYKNWTIIFEELPINYLYNINVQILTRIGKGTILPQNSRSYWNSLFQNFPIIIQIEDIENNSNVKKVTYGIGFFITKSDFDSITQNWGEIEAKMLLQLYNPNNYF